MTCWQILGLDTNATPREIKRAYAKKLKVTRPEDDADAFQQLYSAYKQALYLQKQAQQPTSSPQLQVGTDSEQLAALIEQAEDVLVRMSGQQEINAPLTASQTPEEVEQTAQQKAALQTLTDQAICIVQDKAQRNQLNAWQFLELSPEVLDPEINSELGLRVFAEIYQVNQAFDALSRKKKRYAGTNDTVLPAILAYLNGIFNWSGQQNLLYHYVGEEACALLLPLIFNEQEKSHYHAVDPSKMLKGGKLTRKRSSHLEPSRHDLSAGDSYNKAVTLTGVASVLFSLGVLSQLSKLQASDNLIVQNLAFIVVIYLAIQWFGLKKNKPIALYATALFCMLLLASFPIGTLFGALILINLYKSGRLFNFD